MYSFLKLNSSACCSSGGAYSLRVPNIPCQACEEGESPVHTPAVAPSARAWVCWGMHGVPKLTRFCSFHSLRLRGRPW